MKHLIYCLVGGFLISTTAFGQKQEKEIGSVTNGYYRITADKTDLKRIINKHLSDRDLNTTVTSLDIRKGTLANASEEYYMLFAENSAHNVKIAIELKLRNNALIATFVDKTFEMICICNGYDNGCMPQLAQGKNERVWRCSSCNGSIKGNTKMKKRKCTKTVTLSTPDN